MKIEVETYDIEDRATVWKSADILNHFEVSFEVNDDAFIDINVSDIKLNNYEIIDGLEFNIFHYVDEKDLDKYDDAEIAFMAYKNGLPMFLYILLDDVLYCYELKYIYIDLAVEGSYRMCSRYNVSNTGTYKKMMMLGIPEDGLSDSAINKMIEQGTKIIKIN